MPVTTMHGKWSEAGVPHKGWTCTSIHDLGEPNQTCEMCESMTIRYVHTMEHPNYSGPLEVGCVCSGNMEEDLAGAKLREKTFKLRMKRRQRLLTRSWNVSRAGNSYLNVDGFNLVIYPRAGCWGARVEHCSTGWQMLTRSFDTPEKTKLAAFDVMQKMQQAIAKHRPDEPHDWRGPEGD